MPSCTTASFQKTKMIPQPIPVGGFLLYQVDQTENYLLLFFAEPGPAVQQFPLRCGRGSVSLFSALVTGYTYTTKGHFLYPLDCGNGDKVQ